jgi:hypothetical protein
MAPWGARHLTGTQTSLTRSHSVVGVTLPRAATAESSPHTSRASVVEPVAEAGPVQTSGLSPSPVSVANVSWLDDRYRLTSDGLPKRRWITFPGLAVCCGSSYTDSRHPGVHSVSRLTATGHRTGTVPMRNERRCDSREGIKMCPVERQLLDSPGCLKGHRARKDSPIRFTR